MEWTPDTTIALIRLYQRCPMLWDPTHSRYKSKEERTSALEAISAELRVDQFVIEKKLRNLLTQFARESRKLRLARKAGRPYEPKWFGYNHLQFLAATRKARPTYSTSESEQEDELNGDRVTATPLELPSISNNGHFKVDEQNESFQDSGSSCSSNVQVTEDRRLFKLSTSFPMPKRSSDVPRSSDSFRSSKKPKLDTDPDVLFGDYVTRSVARLPIPLKMKVKRMITDVLFDAEEGKLLTTDEAVVEARSIKEEPFITVE